MHQAIDPISHQTFEAVRNISPFSSQQVFTSGPSSSEKKDETHEAKPSIFRPILRFVTPLLDNISEKRSVIVRRVSSGVEERRKFASQMFQNVQSSYQSTLAVAHEKATYSRQFVENVYREPSSFIQTAKQSSGKAVASTVSLGISVPRYFLHRIRSAVEVLEKHRSADESGSNSLRWNFLLPPVVFQYANATIDFSDGLLVRVSSHFIPTEASPVLESGMSSENIDSSSHELDTLETDSDE